MLIIIFLPTILFEAYLLLSILSLNFWCMNIPTPTLLRSSFLTPLYIGCSVLNWITVCLLFTSKISWSLLFVIDISNWMSFSSLESLTLYQFVCEDRFWYYEILVVFQWAGDWPGPPTILLYPGLGPAMRVTELFDFPSTVPVGVMKNRI